MEVSYIQFNLHTCHKQFYFQGSNGKDIAKQLHLSQVLTPDSLTAWTNKQHLEGLNPE